MQKSSIYDLIARKDSQPARNKEQRSEEHKGEQERKQEQIATVVN